MKRGGLGRGLSALIPGAAEEAGLLEIPVGAIEVTLKVAACVKVPPATVKTSPTT